MRITCVAVVDRSKMFRIFRVAILERIVQAIQVQVERDFAPAWSRIPVPVFLVQDGAPVPLGAAMVYLVDRITEVKGAAGFHRVDERGFFAGFVAVEAIGRLGGTANKGASSISVALSHEVLEMLANPAVNLWADGPDGRSYAHEICDPVAGDCYEIDVEPYSQGPAEPVSVSNFVLPDWFNPRASSGAWIDHMQVLSSPFTSRESGYMTVFERGEERDVYGPLVPAAKQEARAASGRCARAREAGCGGGVVGYPPKPANDLG